MSDKKEKEWKEIEKDNKKRKSNIIGEYGFDIEEYTKKKLSEESQEKEKKRNKKIKIIVILVIILIILLQVNSISKQGKARVEEKLINEIKNTSFNEAVEIVSEQTYWKGRGFYKLRVKDTPDIEYNAVVTGDNFNETGYSSDFQSRYYKYYFEKWENEHKYKFIPNEVYEDCSYGIITKKNWRLTFYTYIEVNNYEEMIEAAEDINKLLEFIGNRKISVSSYIKVENEFIMPVGETNEEVIENFKKQYEDAIK